MQLFLRSTAIFIAFAVHAHCAEGVVFRQQYKAGQSYRQTISMDQQMTVESDAPRMEQRTTTAMGITVSVKEHEDGRSRRATVRYDRAVLGLEASGQKFSFDSQHPDAVNAGPLYAFGRVVGQEFRVVFDENDAVKDVENSEEVVKRLSSVDRGNAQLYETLFNRAAVKRMMQQSALRSPGAKALSPGDTWPLKTEIELPKIGKLLIEGTYTFKRMTDFAGVACAEVESKAEITIDATSKGGGSAKSESLIEQMRMKAEQGTMEGRFLYDPELGFCRKIEMNQSVTLTALIPDKTNVVFRMPMKQKVTVTLDAVGAALPPLPDAE